MSEEQKEKESKKDGNNNSSLEETARDNVVTIYVNEFTESAVKDFYDEFKKAQLSEQSILPIIIDSYGGDCYAVLPMIDLIKSSKIPVATIAMGKAMSCGADLLAAGTKGMRYASPYCSIMVHTTSSLAAGKLADLKIDVKETERLDNLLVYLLDEHCGQDRGYWNEVFKDNLNTNIYMTAKKAKERGLIDHVKVPSLETFVVAKTVLL